MFNPFRIHEFIQNSEEKLVKTCYLVSDSAKNYQKLYSEVATHYENSKLLSQKIFRKIQNKRLWNYFLSFMIIPRSPLVF